MLNYFSQQLTTLYLMPRVGIFLMFTYVASVQAVQDKKELLVRIGETVTTIETHTTTGEGIGMSGVPVIQPHKSVVQSTITKGFPQSELGTELPIDGTKAVTVSVIGKNRSTGMEEGRMVNKLNEIQKVFSLKSPRQDVELFLDSAEIIEGNGEPQLKLQIGFRNITHYLLRMTARSISEGQLVLADNSGQSVTAVQIGPSGSKVGTIFYKLPPVNGGYTLQVPTDTPFNVDVPKE
jgi:hypothetical protein